MVSAIKSLQKIIETEIKIQGFFIQLELVTKRKKNLNLIEKNYLKYVIQVQNCEKTRNLFMFFLLQLPCLVA
jgi:hypothetical protein